MNCPNCGSPRLYQFESKRPTQAPLPIVCRSCGRITIGGEPIDLPEVLAGPIRELAESSAGAGVDGRAALEELAKADSSVRIEQYMAKFYRAAYLDGFFRALAFFRHHAKEGRLRRLRDLWNQIHNREFLSASVVTVVMSEVEYTEFEQLLNLNVLPGAADVARPSHKNPSVPRGGTRLS